MARASLPRRTLLVGYFDRGNVGDDLMRDALLEGLPPLLPPDTAIEARRLPALSRGGLLEAVRLVPALLRADLVLLAGGSHFHDRFGWRSVRILALLLGLFALARLGGARVGFAGVGIGPLGRRASRALVRQLLRLANAVLVRDPRSARIAHRLAPGCSVVEGLDLALLLPPHEAPQKPHGDVATLGISVIPYFKEFEEDEQRDTRVIETLADAICAIDSELALRVHVLPLFDPPTGPSRSDRGLSELLGTLLRDHGIETEVCPSGVDQVRGAVAACEAVMATRYHAALLAYVSTRPMMMVTYDAKCLGLADQIGLPSTARLPPHELLDRELLGARLRALRATPTDFTATLSLEEARNLTVTSLDAFVHQLVRQPPGVRP